MPGSWQELLARTGNTQDPVGNLSREQEHGGTGRNPQRGVGLGGLTGTFTGSGTTWDTLGPISWAGENAGSGREYVGPGQSPHPRSRTCWSWRKLLARTENMPVWWGGAQPGWVQVAASGNRRGACGSLSFWGCPWSTKIAFANTWRTLAARRPVSTLECKTWPLKTLRDQLVLFPHCTGPRESQGLA